MPTEISQPWTGTVLGDATRAPYSDTEWDDMYESLFGSDVNAGAIGGFLNELVVTGTASPLSVASGGALVKGKWYRNTAPVSVVVPSPGGSTRIDTIVLQSSWAAQTIRIARHAGIEGGGAPTLTQIDGTTWEIPLANASITVGGVVTLTDRRIFLANSPSWTQFYDGSAMAATDSLGAIWSAGYESWYFGPAAQANTVLYFTVPLGFRGSNFKVWLYWMGMGVPGATPQVVWSVLFTRYREGDDVGLSVVSGSWGQYQPSGGGWANVITQRLLIITPVLFNAGTIFETAAAAGNLVRLLISRAGADADDNYAGNAHLMGVLVKAS